MVPPSGGAKIEMIIRVNQTRCNNDVVYSNRPDHTIKKISWINCR